MFRILIVDDERIILNGIRMMIQEGCGLSFPTEVVTASNVPQAVEVLEAGEQLKDVPWQEPLGKDSETP